MPARADAQESVRSVRMLSSPAPRASVLLLLVWSFALGCSTSANPNQCRVDTDVLCPGDFVGYSCQGESKPSATCGAGTLQSDGETGYCCGVQNPGKCVADTSSGCEGGATGYVCSNGVDPSDSEPSLSCDAGGAGGAGQDADENDARYCCSSR
jgi:hypothetical protein